MEYHFYFPHHLNKLLLEYMYAFSVFHGNINYQDFWFIIYMKNKNRKIFSWKFIILLLANVLEIEDEIYMCICI